MMSSLLDFTVQGDVGTMTDESKLPLVKLMEPLQLYRLWERQAWVSHEIDLAQDRRDLARRKLVCDRPSRVPVERSEIEKMATNVNAMTLSIRDLASLTKVLLDAGLLYDESEPEKGEAA